MVETAVTDVVRGTVATDDPLAALDEVLGQALQLLAYGAIGLLDAAIDHDLKLRSQLLRLIGIEHVVDPCLHQLFGFSRSVFVLDSLLEELNYALTHLLVGQLHAEAELAEVLEEGVGPSRTAAHVVLRVGRGGDGAGVDRGATRSVGQHLAVAIELADELHVGRLAATGTGSGELEERRGEL